MAEAKILPHTDQNNGRLDFIVLREHCKGIGANLRELIIAINVMEMLFYSGEKQPHMEWEEFKKQLTKIFTIYDHYKGRNIYSDLLKLCTLIGK